MPRPTLRERLRLALRPPRTLKVTPLGRVYLVMTLGIGLAALNTGNNLLYLVLGVMLAVIVLSGVLSERAIWDVTVRRLLPEGVRAQEPFPLRYEVARKKGTVFGLKLTEVTPGLTAAAFVPMVEAGLSTVVRGEALARQRGPLRLAELEVGTTYPFGIFEKSRRLALQDLLLVYPRRGFACEPTDLASARTAGDSGTPRKRDGTGDLVGLRELEPLEDARRVHWRKSASVGRLIRVEREREERRHYDLEIAPDLAGEALERACEDLAAQGELLLSRGFDVGLTAGKSRLRAGSGPGHERRLLAALAWLGFEETP